MTQIKTDAGPLAKFHAVERAVPEARLAIEDLDDDGIRIRDRFAGADGTSKPLETSPFSASDGVKAQLSIDAQHLQKKDKKELLKALDKYQGKLESNRHIHDGSRTALLGTIGNLRNMIEAGRYANATMHAGILQFGTTGLLNQENGDKLEKFQSDAHKIIRLTHSVSFYNNIDQAAQSDDPAQQQRLLKNAKAAVDFVMNDIAGELIRVKMGSTPRDKMGELAERSKDLATRKLSDKYAMLECLNSAIS